MTLVRVKVQAQAEDGLAAAVGSLRWQPTARRIVPGTPDAIVLPTPFTVPLDAGSVDVEVVPSTLAWVWYVTENFHGVHPRRRYLVVPDVASVDYSDLVEVDPATLTPEPSPDPAWLEPLTTVAAGAVTPDPDNPGFYLIGVTP